MPKKPPPNSEADSPQADSSQAERNIAEEFLLLWQEQIGLWLSDPGTSEQIQDIFRQFAHRPGFNTQFPFAGGEPHGASEAKASSIPTPPFAPSVGGEPNLRELITRIKALEERITALEQHPQRPRRRVKKPPQ
ncbi:MAG: hypothetical protein ORN98_09950 [Alphaproteobacteria bacterium]|nr:hypothetical protein [Alphaproteobacteria bacterium]